MSFEYRILQESTENFSDDSAVMLGEGGYGTVYRAVMKGYGFNCIVKRFFPTQVGEVRKSKYASTVNLQSPQQYIVL